MTNTRPNQQATIVCIGSCCQKAPYSASFDRLFLQMCLRDCFWEQFGLYHTLLCYPGAHDGVVPGRLQA
jgi:hypothetical protein